MSFVIRYGNPKTATTKKMKGFLLGRAWGGEPSGVVPLNAAKFAGVSSVEEAGGGRPVSLAIAVRIQRMIVKIPRTEPSVCLRVPNCSATLTIAKKEECVAM